MSEHTYHDLKTALDNQIRNEFSVDQKPENALFKLKNVGKITNLLSGGIINAEKDLEQIRVIINDSVRKQKVFQNFLRGNTREYLVDLTASQFLGIIGRYEVVKGVKKRWKRLEIEMGVLNYANHAAIRDIAHRDLIRLWQGKDSRSIEARQMGWRILQDIVSMDLTANLLSHRQKTARLLTLNKDGQPEVADFSQTGFEDSKPVILPVQGSCYSMGRVGDRFILSAFFNVSLDDYFRSQATSGRLKPHIMLSAQFHQFILYSYFRALKDSTPAVDATDLISIEISASKPQITVNPNNSLLSAEDRFNGHWDQIKSLVDIYEMKGDKALVLKLISPIYHMIRDKVGQVVITDSSLCVVIGRIASHYGMILKEEEFYTMYPDNRRSYNEFLRDFVSNIIRADKL